MLLWRQGYYDRNSKSLLGQDYNAMTARSSQLRLRQHYYDEATSTRGKVVLHLYFDFITPYMATLPLALPSMISMSMGGPHQPLVVLKAAGPGNSNCDSDNCFIFGFLFLSRIFPMTWLPLLWSQSFVFQKKIYFIFKNFSALINSSIYFNGFLSVLCRSQLEVNK